MTGASFDLADELRRFIDREIAQGRFRTADEVVEAGLQMLAERELRLEALRAAAIETDAGIVKRHY